MSVGAKRGWEGEGDGGGGWDWEGDGEGDCHIMGEERGGWG